MQDSQIKLILCPRCPNGSVSHTGLITSVHGTAKVLRANGINVLVRSVMNRADIERMLREEQPTHVVINALWLPTVDLTYLVNQYTNTQFAVICHSNIAFLQAEPNAINLLHDAADLELSSLGNFQVAANSSNGAQGIQQAWECPILYLPNLYHLDSNVRVMRRKWSGGTLRIGAFGAIRPLKNPTASAFAALAIATMLATDLDFHVNVGRDDQGGATRLMPALEAIFRGVPYARLVKDPWTNWPQFRRIVRGMHLLLQPSFTETFNIVTADGVAEGIPSVVSNTIEWAPKHWRADPDDTDDIARVGRLLIGDPHSSHDGERSLTIHNADGVHRWKNWLHAAPGY